MTDYLSKPVIVLGANHSGTRVLVDMLSELGSDGGRCRNEWRENELFLEAHRILVDARSVRDWNDRIFDVQYLIRSRPDNTRKSKVKHLLDVGMAAEFPGRASAPWHWKCPTSGFFLDFWQELYPDAFYLHLVRDRLDVASSLIVRRQFYSIRSALRFYESTERLIAKAHLRNYLRIEYAALRDSLPQILQFVPGLKPERTEHARNLVKEPKRGWNSQRSVKRNVWALLTEGRINFARRLDPHLGTPE